jgi:excisionase family DNA binding protein
MLMTQTQNQPSAASKQFYTVEELSSRWCRSIETVRRYIREGKLRATYIGGYLVPREAVEEFERERTPDL